MIREIPTAGENEIKRFWKKVNIQHGGCWNWVGYINKWGYGTFGMFGDVFLAHRVSWIICTRTSPGQLCVLHRCDNPNCVRPDHLFLGTDLDNARDKIKKGRMVLNPPSGNRHWSKRMPQKIARGERNGQAILTDIVVASIRDEYSKGGITFKEIGNRYGMDLSSVRNAIVGRTWRHVPMPNFVDR